VHHASAPHPLTCAHTCVHTHTHARGRRVAPPGVPAAERLFIGAAERSARLERKAAAAAESDLAGCTFAPRTNAAANALVLQQYEYVPLHERLGQVVRSRSEKLAAIQQQVRRAELRCFLLAVAEAHDRRRVHVPPRATSAHLRHTHTHTHHTHTHTHTPLPHPHAGGGGAEQRRHVCAANQQPLSSAGRAAAQQERQQAAARGSSRALAGCCCCCVWRPGRQPWWRAHTGHSRRQVGGHARTLAATWLRQRRQRRCAADVAQRAPPHRAGGGWCWQQRGGRPAAAAAVAAAPCWCCCCCCWRPLAAGWWGRSGPGSSGRL
jgi:hypothetical protein